MESQQLMQSPKSMIHATFFFIKSLCVDQNPKKTSVHKAYIQFIYFI